jgi:hypothetical protein
MKAWLISLVGQGDHELKLVSEETFKWLTNKDASAPSQQKVAVTRKKWTGSSPDNDRALDVDAEIGEVFWTITDMMKYVREHDLEIADTYDGVIY